MNMVNLTARFIETNEDGRLIIEGSITSDFARKYLFITPAYTFFLLILNQEVKTIKMNYLISHIGLNQNK